MALADLHSQKWYEWKREMEEKRRRRWRERVSRWANVELSEEDDDWEEEEVEANDADENGEEEEGEMEVKEAEEQEEEEEEGENEVEREVKDNEEVGEEEESEVKDAEELQEGEEEEEGEKVKVDEKDEREVKEPEEEEDNGENEVEREVNERDEEDSEVKEVEEMEEGEEEEENDIEKGVKENEEVDEEEEEKVQEAGGSEDGEEEGENANDRKVKESEEVDEEEEREVKEVQEMAEGEEEGENEVEWEVKESEEVDEEEEMKVQEAGGSEEAEEEGENANDRKFKENKEVDEEEEREVKEAEEMAEGEEERENKVEREVQESEEDDEEEVREVKEEEWVEGGEFGDEDDGEEEQIRDNHLGEQSTKNMNQRRSEDEQIQQNQGSAMQEDENFSDSVESDNEDSNLTGFEDEKEKGANECCNFGGTKDEERVVEKQYQDPEELQDPDEKSWRNENSTPGAWASQERKEKKDEKRTEGDGFRETVADSWTSHEEFQEHQDALQEEEEEEELTDDEEAGHSMDEDVASDENVVQIYCQDDYPTHIFHTLTEFRESSLLTDLTLSTEDGKSFHIHSPVLAAVSSLIRESLSGSDVENDKADEIKDHDKSVGVQRWSVSLGPEVDHVGLEAVVEFAYTGLISRLNNDTVDQIKAAAKTLGAPRVLDLCTKEEEKSTKTGGQKKEEGISAAEQMVISLQSIKQLWMDRVGCDVILKALGASLHVHRVILAASSDYFRGMFTLGMRESLQPCVVLPFLLASELEVLIGCSYSGAVPLSWSCVFEITGISFQLQYQPALSLCLSFLQQEINPHSCLDVAAFAEAYDMVPLLEVADDFILRQFQKVACTSKFKDLPVKQLLKYLNSCSLCVPSELVVFKAVVAWIQAKPKRRLKLAKELMKTIHFPLMTFKEFKEVQTLNMWSDHSLEELYESVFEDFCSNDTPPQSHCRIYLLKESLVLIGGDQICEDLASRSISRELWFGNALVNHTGIKKAMEWRRLGEMPEPARFGHEVAVLKGQLYVFGGKKYYGIGDTLDSVYRYDPFQNSWEKLAEMQVKRCAFSVVVLDENIYAIGGHCDPDYIESVERYCPTANSWSFTRPLDLPLSGHVAKVLQGQIFVSGGLNSDYLCLASMFLYHPETGSTYLANMTKPHAHHCMETLGDRLYVAGGITTHDNMIVIDHLACEVYNPAADSWTAFTSLPVPHVGAGSVVLEGKFYVLGGYSHEDFSDTKMIHRYDPSIYRWENIGKMPGPNNDIRASLLCLPSHVRL